MKPRLIGFGTIFALAISLFAGPPAVALPSVVSEPSWNLINLQAARDMGLDGRDQVVAVIDTGIQLDHPYLQGLVVEGLCLEMDSSCPNKTNRQEGIAAAQSKVNPDGTVNSRYLHGSMVAGTIAGSPNGQAVGGMAPATKIIMARVDLNGSTGGKSYIQQALEWVYSLRTKYKIAAVNMSFGYPVPERVAKRCGGDAGIARIFAELRSAGIAPLVASGNGGNLVGISGPSCEPGAISIGATEADGTIAEYSNISDKIDLLAPAPAKTASVFRVNEYDKGSGTSNATPTVAGLFALGKQLRPDFSVDQLLSAMKATGKPTDDIIVKGLPLIDVKAFLNYITPGSTYDTNQKVNKPLALKFVSDGASGGTLSWALDSANTLSKNTKHLVQQSTDGGKNWTDSTFTVSGSQAILSSLERSKSYTFRVGIEDAGLIYWAAPIQAKTPVAETSSSPTQLQLVDSDSNSVQVAWVPPAEDGGSQVTSYEVEISQDGGSTWNLVDSVPAEANSASINDLDSETTYAIRVSAINVVGSSKPSTQISVTLPAAGSSSRVLKPVDGTWVRNITSSSINVFWVPSASPLAARVRAHVVWIKTSKAKTWIKAGTFGGSVTSAAIGKLSKATSYLIRIESITDLGPVMGAQESFKTRSK